MLTHPRMGAVWSLECGPSPPPAERRGAGLRKVLGGGQPGSPQEPSSFWEFMASDSDRNVCGGENKDSPDLLLIVRDTGTQETTHTHTHTHTHADFASAIWKKRHTHIGGTVDPGSVSRRGATATTHSLKAAGKSKHVGGRALAQHPLPGHPFPPPSPTVDRNQGGGGACKKQGHPAPWRPG